MTDHIRTLLTSHVEHIREQAPIWVALATLDAVRWHQTDVDKAGEPYLGHLFRVAAQVADDPAAVVVALLHDALEDHGDEINPAYLADTYGPDVVAALEALTRLPHEPYPEYIGRVAAAGPLAVKVKQADLMDNVVRLDALDDMTAGRLRRKYLPALQQLAETDRRSVR